MLLLRIRKIRLLCASDYVRNHSLILFCHLLGNGDRNMARIFVVVFPFNENNNDKNDADDGKVLFDNCCLLNCGVIPCNRHYLVKPFLALLYLTIITAIATCHYIISVIIYKRFFAAMLCPIEALAINEHKLHY